MFNEIKNWNWTPRAYRIKWWLQFTLALIGFGAFFLFINWLEGVI